jgi:hypothetical protein
MLMRTERQFKVEAAARGAAERAAAASAAAEAEARDALAAATAELATVQIERETVSRVRRRAAAGCLGTTA